MGAGQHHVVQFVDLHDAHALVGHVRLGVPGRMGPVHQLLIFHGLAVDDQGGSELEGVDDLLAVHGGLVDGSQVLVRGDNVEIAVLIHQQYVEVGLAGVAVNVSLAQHEGVAGEAGEEVAVDGDNRVQAAGDGADGLLGVGVETRGVGREGGTHLGGFLDDNVSEVIHHAPGFASVHPVVLHADGGIFINRNIGSVGKGNQLRAALLDIQGQGAELSAVFFLHVDVGRAFREGRQRLHRGGGSRHRRGRGRGFLSGCGSGLFRGGSGGISGLVRGRNIGSVCAEAHDHYQ